MADEIRDFKKKELKFMQKHILAVNNMELMELTNFSKGWFMAKPDLDIDVFNQVQDVINIQEEFLLAKPQHSVVAEGAEFKEGDL